MFRDGQAKSTDIQILNIFRSTGTVNGCSHLHEEYLTIGPDP